MTHAIVHVTYFHKSQFIPMGRIAMNARTIYFEYEKSFLETGLELSPFKLPLKPGVLACEDPVFDGLFGLFNDSLPDGWGRLLLDRKLMQMGIQPGALTPLDRLRFVGKHGMGALAYTPESTKDHPTPQVLEELDRIAEECLAVLEHDEDQYVDDLLLLTNSSSGARPKILVNLISKERASNNDWIIKFRAPNDPKDIGAIEYAYHLMASAAGLEVPEAKLFSSKKCPGYFGVERFDRQKSSYLHMHTLSGLLHADYRIPSIDYDTVMKATLWLTKDVRECEKQFRNCAFNVLAHNRDDHAKNFSFLMDETGVWRVSPAYDLTFSSGPAGEHSTTVLGEGKNPTLSHLVKLSQVGSIKEARAKEIIEEVQAAVGRWSEFSKQSHVSSKSRTIIQNALNILS